MDKNVESFLETQTMMEKPNPKIENPNQNFIQVLDKFPLKDFNDLKKIEQKLKKDDTFHSKVVNNFFFLILHEHCNFYIIFRSMHCI